MGFKVKVTALLLLMSVCAANLFAQQQHPPGIVVDDATANKALNDCASRFPKFYREFNYIKTHDTLIKKFVFMRYKTNTGPAKAGPRGNIFIDIKYLEQLQPNFTDDRMIVVLYHEIGHLHYYVKATNLTQLRDSEESEKAAFEYSLLKTKEIAEKGDCGPLKTGVWFMKQRSEGNNLQDPHVRALKRMVQEPLYAGYVQYVNQHCN